MSFIPSIFKSKRKKKPFDKRQIIDVILRTEGLEDITLLCINNAGSNGIDTHDLNYDIANHIFDDPAYADYATIIKEITDHFHAIRVRLSKEDQIGFNKMQKVWYPKTLKSRKLTHKEERFFKAQGLEAPGWINIQNKLEAIRWLHREFSDDEFERFCCALLEYSHVTNVTVTEKRKGSGADGGLDGIGEYILDGVKIPIAFEAKRYALDKEVGTDICQKLIGAMMANDIKHGFIITTAKVSKRSKAMVEKFKADHNYQIECICQDRMADIMLCKENAAHGFGLHRTEKGLLYMNSDILKIAVKKHK